jgi:hypothetical protein
MAHLRSAFVAIALGSALVSRSAVAQHGASVSLTHTVTVTVPPRVKVQVGNAQVSPRAMSVSGLPSANGLSLSISATQPWTLSIGTAATDGQLQWSRDGHSDFSAVTDRQSTVASGALSQIPTSATVYVRSAASKGAGGNTDPDTVMLTVVAQ